MTKKDRQKFWASNWKLFPKKGHSKIFRPPKLGRRKVSANVVMYSHLHHILLVVLFKERLT